MINTKNLGMLVLAVFLIYSGLSFFVSALSFGALSAGLAIAAGVLLLLGK